ncbi:cytochrome P450 [Roseomonas populi]|uniref:Cytochrome P450 n=1 Tax=Roseomonas populi TaxID=3121582 RepID=A0ABT1XAV8_9PROT|nr:cytochrome P450 [Roseomonas pecuniae]MCR0985258.1 cytochrome P450 [Roseomonas pecuniae]
MTVAESPLPRYRPPAPIPSGNLGTFLKVLLSRDANLLTALPRRAYDMFMGERAMGDRRLYLINHPETAREVMVERAENYPKAAVFVDALSPLVGDGVFVANGRSWRRQRDLIRPAMSQMALSKAYPHMGAAVADCVARVAAHARAGKPFALDAELSHVTADVVFRTIFSEPIEAGEAATVFEAFTRFQALSDQLAPWKLLYSRKHAAPPQAAGFRAACAAIRGTLGRMVDRRLAAGSPAGRDIADALIAAADPDTGRGFTREELVDQIAVFFLAGHETTASMLTWAFVILANLPEAAERIRAEAEELGEGTPGLDAIQAGLPYTKRVLREVLRLYPPVGFLVRSPLAPDKVRRWTLQPRDIVVVSPWVIHRHRVFWKDPDIFDPDRFLPERASGITKDSYIPFGLGPRVCPGAAFATVESTLLLARLLQHFDIAPTAPARIQPTARLTIRPNGTVLCRARPRG